MKFMEIVFNFSQASKILSYNYTVHNQNSQEECGVLKLLGVYCILLFVGSLFFNTSLLLIFLKNNKLVNNMTVFIIALVVLNIFATAVEVPFIIISNLKCGYGNFILHLILNSIFFKNLHQ